MTVLQRRMRLRLSYIARISSRLKRTKYSLGYRTQVHQVRKLGTLCIMLTLTDNSNLEFRFYNCDVLTAIMLPSYLLPNRTSMNFYPHLETKQQRC